MKSFLNFFPNHHLRKTNSPFLINQNEKITFSQFKKKLLETAAILKEKGIKPKDNIAVISENNMDFVFIVFALWILKAVPVLINIRLTNGEKKKLISFSECKFTLIEKKLSAEINLPKEKIILFPFNKKSQKKISSKKINLNDIALIIFSSGSTGKPKAVTLSFNNLIQSALIGNQFLKINSKDKLLASLPFYHVGGFSILIRAFIFGASVIFPNSLKTEDIASSIKKEKPTHASFVSSQLQSLIEKNIDPNNFKNILLGGGFFSLELINSALKKGWKISKSYGSTETSSFVTAMNFKELKNKPNASGKALHPNEIFIVVKNHKKLNTNEIGEIAVKSSAVTKGYFKNEKETKAKLKNNIFFTGDIGFIDEEGFLFVEARRNDLIISGGENVNPVEVETEILKHHQIKEACVFGLPDNKWGQIISAAIVTENKNISLIDLKKFLKHKLADYKIPKKIFLLNKLPKTELGKVQKEKIKKMFVQ